MIVPGRTLILFGLMFSLLAAFVAEKAYSQQAANKSRANSVRPPEIEMVFVKGGTFTMGCLPERDGDCNGNEKPAHKVTVSDFYIGKYQVTQAEWRAVMGNKPSHSPGDNKPVESVSWNDVQEFIKRLNSMTGKNYRLPTEAEWEYAARGGANSRGYRYSGGNDVDAVAWYYENSGVQKLNDSAWSDRAAVKNNNQTHPVGTKAANELGIHDMSGNVWEWVADRYDLYGNEPVADPTGPDQGDERVLRGGNWLGSAVAARPAFRFGFDPDFKSSAYGFRLAYSAK